MNSKQTAFFDNLPACISLNFLLAALFAFLISLKDFPVEIIERNIREMCIWWNVFTNPLIMDRFSVTDPEGVQLNPLPLPPPHFF